MSAGWVNGPSRVNLSSISKIALSLAFTLSLAACSNITTLSPASADAQVSSVPHLQQEYAELAHDGQVYRLDASRSVVRIYAFRAGTGARLGHNHVLNAPQFVGWVYLPQQQLGEARFDLEFRLDSLKLDDPEERARLGEAFAFTPSSGALQRTREHMLGVDNLDAERFPYLRIHSLQLRGELPKLAVKVQIELHGQQREMWLPLDVSNTEGQLQVRGAMVLRQTDFGVRPYSVLGGFLAVQDELVIEFSLLGVSR